MPAAVAGLVLVALVVGVLLAWTSVPDPLRDPSPLPRLVVAVQVVALGLGSVILAARGEITGGALLAGAGTAAFGAGSRMATRSRRTRRRGTPAGPRLPGAAASPGDSTSRSLVASPTRSATGAPEVLVAVVLALAGLAALASVALREGLPLLDARPVTARLAYSGPPLDLFRWLTPPAAALLVARALRCGTRTASLAALTGTALVVVVETLLASRTLLIELGLTLLLVAWASGWRPGLRAVVVVALAAATVIVGVQAARVAREPNEAFRADPVGFLARAVVSRVGLVGPRALDVVVETIPAREPYFAGASYLRPLPGEDDPRLPLGRWLGARMFPGSAAPPFVAPGVLGEAWANAGPAAVLLLALAGAAASIGHRALRRLPGSPADHVLVALLAVAAARTYATSLNGFLATAAAAAAWRLAIELPRFVERRRATPGADQPSG